MQVYRAPARPAVEMYATCGTLASALPGLLPVTAEDEDAIDRIRAKLHEVQIVLAEIALRRGVNAEAVLAPRPVPKPVTTDDLTKPKRRTEQ